MINQGVSDSAGTCSNILTQFGIEFLYTLLGSVSNPQRVIVGARYSYTTGTFQWRCKTPRDCVDPAIYTGGTEASANAGLSSRPFPIKSFISFVKVDGESQLWTPLPPRIFAQLPNDVWYPFNIPV